MNLSSHVNIALFIGKEYFSIYKQSLMVIGSLMPDFNPITQPHRSDNLLNRITANIEKIKSAKTDFAKSIHLGVAVHYLCDYFCYAHNYGLDISHGKKHFLYEVSLYNLLKKGYDERLSITSDCNDIIEYIVNAKILYDLKPSNIQRDLKYTLTIVEFLTEHSLKYFNNIKK